MFNIKYIKKNIFLFKIYKNIRNSLNKEKINILYSAGIDSNSLLKSSIYIIGIKNIIIIHINHKISKFDKNIKSKCIFINKLIKIKLFIINLNKNKLLSIKENILRIKREKIYKIFNKKFKIKTLWSGYNKNDKIETNFLYFITNIKKKIKNIFYKNKNYLIQKKKPFKNIKKKYIKKIFLKKINWIEETNNLKKKNIRNIIRIKLLSKIKFYKRCGWEV